MNSPEKKQLKLTFCSGAGAVTGANFLLETLDGKKILIDCGMEQGTSEADETNWSPFPYNPSEIDILFITHAHIDHIGRIPKLVSEGFKGRIISIDATRDLAGPMLEDTCSILSHYDDENIKKMYTHQVVAQALEMWEGVKYHQDINLDHGFKCRFYDSGHILGSGMLYMEYGSKKFLFTGDLGNSPSPLLADTEIVKEIDYLLIESVYGDRNHEDRNIRKKRLEQVIEDNYKRGGVLVLPTFSLERAQELLFEIDDLVENQRVPQMPVFLDSPLAIRLTKVYRKYMNYFNADAQKRMQDDDDIFSFPGLKVTLETEESKSILHAPNPKIIIAGSGMSNGGRVLHHEANYLPDPNNTILLTGFQSLGTLGRSIIEGAKEIRINGQTIPVRAIIERIDGYSGHKDSEHLVEFVSNMTDSLEKVFVCMGEPKSATFLAQRLRDYLGVYAQTPMMGDEVTLDC